MQCTGTLAVATLLISGSLAISLRNAAPCLDDRPARSSEDTVKDDWACFTFCGGTVRPSQCDDCCLDKGGATSDEAPTTKPSKEGGGATKEDKEDEDGDGEQTTEGGDEASTEEEASTEAAAEGGE